MAAKNTATVEAETVENTVSKYTLDRLRDNCLKLFGVTTSTFDGATSGMMGEYSVEEIKTQLENWGKKEAK